MLHYLTNVFPDVFELHDRQLVQAWKEAGFKPQALQSITNMPKISLGTWVGGDRDGHPLVTPEITEYTLGRLRIEALHLVRQRLLLLADSLSIYTPETTLPAEFLQHKISLSLQIPNISDNDWLNSTSREPFKQYVLLLVEKLPLKQDHLLGNSSISFASWTFTHSGQLLSELEILLRAISDWGAPTHGNQ